MERLYQMHVIPDILSSLQPTVDLRVVFPEAPPKNPVLRARAKRKTVPVEAGVFLVNEQVYTNVEAVFPTGVDPVMFRRAGHRRFIPRFSIRSQGCIPCL